MQKLPEATIRNRGDACAKKREHPDKRRKLISFCSDQRSNNTLLTGGGCRAFVFRRRVG